MRISIIGCGLAGKALGRVFSRAGHDLVAVTCREEARAREAAAFVGASRGLVDPAAAAADADLVLVCVPDDAISGVAAALRLPAGCMAAHVSGGHSAEELAPCRPRGAMHPLRSFADPEKAAREFAGTFCALDGDPEAVERLGEMVRGAGGVPFTVRSEGKGLYHAGAVFASNYVVALFEAALRLFERAGVSRKEAHAALSALTSGTASNIRTVGIPGALTGPVERGDVGMIRRHLDALGEGEEDLRRLYGGLARLASEVALAKGSIDRKTAARILAAVGEEASRRKGE